MTRIIKNDVPMVRIILLSEDVAKHDGNVVTVSAVVIVCSNLVMSSAFCASNFRSNHTCSSDPVSFKSWES